MFPAHAGMNRGEGPQPTAVFDVPRTRGDEPKAFKLSTTKKICSPHTRG